MSQLPATVNTVDIQTARLNADEYLRNFSDMHPPLGPTAALVEADRCYFCYDAPCMTACPTGIDVAGFIRMIQAGNNIGAARLILQENILGGSCARVCPTETLCEQACVRNDQDQRPVSIGLLQRHAVDVAIDADKQFFQREADTGKRIAIVGAGPASLSCAHGLARHGHSVTIFEAREKSGGLNEYGLAAYKMLDDFASREIEYILAIGNIDIRYQQRLGEDFDLASLQRDYDAVFLGIGLGGVNNLGLVNEDDEGVMNAVDYIAQLRQSNNLADLPVGRRVVVIGGGMTAIDMATQIRLLGADEVTLVYRRDKAAMNASQKEQEFTQIKGVTIRYNARPHRIQTKGGQVCGVEFERTRTDANGSLENTDDFFSLPADMLFKAIGQTFEAPSGTSFALSKGRIQVDAQRNTSIAGIWAGGDAVCDGEDLTVAATQDGKLAASSINQYLSNPAPKQLRREG
ncbi:MAG: dihydropyrimidine dehydrogenase (NAD+) subunit PreT [Gammaproteobacteria bacterium]|jgi:dihydropyrimidine dehydrogenase (NAD+) subunit PreT